MSSKNMSYEINTKSEIKKSKLIKNNNKFIDLLSINDPKIKDIVLDFIIMLETNFSNECTYNFYNNINNTQIKRKRFSLFSRENGYFENDHENGNDNEIVVKDYPYLYHELFHLASFSFSDKTSFNGFSQEYEDDNVLYTIGDGINEGYTELMTRRYFEGNYLESAYNYQVGVVEKLEQIIGKEKMEELYLKADLYGLIEELSRYTSKDVVRDFILFNDFLLYQDNAKMNKVKKQEAVQEALSEINDFLAGVFLVKQQIRKDNNEIDEEEFLNTLRNYVKLFIMKNEDGTYTYPNNSDSLNELLDALEMKQENPVYVKKH